MKSKSAIVLVTVAIVFAIGFTSIQFFGDYGWTVFVFVPVLIGFLPSYFASKRIELSMRSSYFLSLQVLFIFLLLLLTFAIDGLACLVMSLPILAIITWIGGYLSYYLNNKKSKLSRGHVTIILAFYSLCFLSFDYINEPEELIPVTTQTLIHAPLEKVWENTVAFDSMTTPDEAIFKTGVAYPIKAVIKKSGVGGKRYVYFSTGNLNQHITCWDEPNLLHFSIESSPAVVREWNPFWTLDPQHLKGYFKPYKGQFKLERTANNVTLLESTTWYKVDVYPQLYWKTWANIIIRKIHYRVLQHIKTESEKENAQSRNTPEIS
ncbi:hypothetical protein [Flavobacterium sp.]